MDDLIGEKLLICGYFISTISTLYIQLKHTEYDSPQKQLKTYISVENGIILWLEIMQEINEKITTNIVHIVLFTLIVYTVQCTYDHHYYYYYHH